MSEASFKQVDEALRQIQSLSADPGKKTRKGTAQSQRKKKFHFRRFCLKLFCWIAAIVLAIVLPFIVLIRVAVYVYVVHGISTWPAVAAGACITSILLMIYSLIVTRRLGGKARSFKRSAKAVLLVVILYCGYSLLYISGENVKSEALQETYTALHPLIRLSVSTVALVDHGMIVTDTERQPEDYVAMGLQPLENSLHYRQADGFAHAVDLRTMGRSEWQNAAINLYFRLMGFKTLRHTGTADHLHVSLPLNF